MPTTKTQATYTRQFIAWELKSLKQRTLLPPHDFRITALIVLLEDHCGVRYSIDVVEQTLYALRVPEVRPGCSTVYWSLSGLEKALDEVPEEEPGPPPPP